MKVNGEIIFSATVAVDKERADQAILKEMLKYKKERIAQDLGMKIAEEKGWEDYEEDGLLKADIRLYVFTPRELKDFIDLKFQKKLMEMDIMDESFSSR
jgi:hypothetical protein